MKHKEIISLLPKDLKGGLTLLYNDYGNQLLNYGIQRFGLNEDESTEALYKTLDTVGRVVTRYEFKSENHFQYWLLKIHRNNVLQLLRHRDRTQVPVVSMEDWIAESLEDEDNFSLELFAGVIEKISGKDPDGKPTYQSQLMFAMQKALLLLNENERELLLLKMNNYSYDEIADLLGIENNQLKVKFIRAKAKVKKKTLEILKDCLS